MRDLTHAGAFMSFQLGASVLCWAKSSNLQIFHILFWSKPNLVGLMKDLRMCSFSKSQVRFFFNEIFHNIIY